MVKIVCVYLISKLSNYVKTISINEELSIGCGDEMIYFKWKRF